MRHGVPKQTSRDVVFESVHLLDADGRTSGIFYEDEPMHVLLRLRANVRATRLEVLCKFSTLEGMLVFTLTSGPLEVELTPDRFVLPVEIPSLPLRRGVYQIDLYVLTRLPQDDVRGAIEFEVAGQRVPDADARKVRDHLGVVSVEHEWGPLTPLDSATSDA